MSQVVFVFPEYVEIPTGGYKVVYEYSNRLVNEGFEVTIVYPEFLYFFKSTLKRKLKMSFFFFYYLVFKRKGARKWFPLNEKIKEKIVFNLEEKNMPSADYYFATAMETATYLEGYKFISQGRKFYIIQGIEDWKWGLEPFLKTWKYNLNKIVVSPWLKNYVESKGENAILIENGVDRPLLKMEITPEKRFKFNIMMLYHKQKLKGAEDGLKALKIVKEKYPELRSIWFGCPRKPAKLPDWIDYYREPDEIKLNELYNGSAIYLGPSKSEGFGLTVGEAMTCGCAVACTDAGGYLTMAKNGETALVSRVGDITNMAENLLKLIEDDELRYSVATKGNINIQRFTWDNATKKLLKVLKDI